MNPKTARFLGLGLPAAAALSLGGCRVPREEVRLKSDVPLAAVERAVLFYEDPGTGRDGFYETRDQR